MLVGLPDAAVKEARERVRSALKNSGYEYPAQRITVNLAPADMKKEGPLYDLPMAVGMLAAMETLPKEKAEPFCMPVSYTHLACLFNSPAGGSAKGSRGSGTDDRGIDRPDAKTVYREL